MTYPDEHQDDMELSANELEDKYNPDVDGDGEHPIITREDWRNEVARKRTLSGYWAWLEHRLIQIMEGTDEEFDLER